MENIGARWRELCEQIAVEKDPVEFGKLFDEVCLLLEQREAELMAMRKEPSGSPTPRAKSVAS
jgi:hypothetical protein